MAARSQQRWRRDQQRELQLDSLDPLTDHSIPLGDSRQTQDTVRGGWLPAGYCAGLLVCTIQYFDFDFTVEGKSSRLIVIKNNIFISTGREEEVDIWML